MYVALWEGNLYAILVECVIDDLLDACRNGDFLLDKHPDANLEVNTTISEVAKGHAYRNVGVRKRLSCGIFFVTDGRECLDEKLPNLLHIGSIGNSDRHFDEFVAMVARHVLEVLAEECAIEESYDAAVDCGNLSALIGNALHSASNSVAFDVVAHMDAS